MPSVAKSIFTSKTFWTNTVALVAFILQTTTGNELITSLENQAIVLTLINVILRSVTKDAVSWS